MNYTVASFPRRLFLHLSLGFSLYWFSNVLVVFPWILSKTLGIITMFLSTLLWGFISFYCLTHALKKDWNRDALSMALSFLLFAIIQDYFLYVVYRDIPGELYELTTILAYTSVFLIPFIVNYIILRRYNVQHIKAITNTKLIIILTIGIISLILTLWSVRFW